MIGSDAVVYSARNIALDLGVSERVIALLIVAVGTSLPELSAAIFASKKGEQDLLIGNSLGSNIFDICIVLGLPILIYGGLNVSSFNFLDLFMISLAALVLFIFTRKDREISRKEGLVMILIFILYYLVTFFWT